MFTDKCLQNSLIYVQSKENVMIKEIEFLERVAFYTLNFCKMTICNKTKIFEGTVNKIEFSF